MSNTIQEKAAELQDHGYCILRGRFTSSQIGACRDSFLPLLQLYLEEHRHEPNRGTCRHFLPMPFEPPCFVPDFFFDNEIISIIQGVIGEKIVADQWGCDVPLSGSDYQEAHVDYSRPLFSEIPYFQFPPYILVISFGLTKIDIENGAIEIAPGTHKMPREEAFQAVKTGAIELQSVPLEIGNVLIRHPWALHRGTPNITDIPRMLVSIRYVRDWYTDSSREVNMIPHNLWKSLTSEQQKIMRFPISSIRRKRFEKSVK